MKRFLISLMVWSLNNCELAYSMDRFAALSMVESGDCDTRIGRAGEISRFQIMPVEWEKIRTENSTVSNNPTDATNAQSVASLIMAGRCHRFERANHRPPTDAEWYLLWHRPARVFKPTQREAARAQRFANLCLKKTYARND